MTRGRKKDYTIPQSRALTQQRDYRARKAREKADLEEKCRRLEEENLSLRQQIEAIKDSSSNVRRDLELAQAASELAGWLAPTYASAHRFQSFLPAEPSSDPLVPPDKDLSTFHWQLPVYPALPVSTRSEEASSLALGLHASTDSEMGGVTLPDPNECCGGIMDCRGLIEEEDNEGEGSDDGTVKSGQSSSQMKA